VVLRKGHSRLSIATARSFVVQLGKVQFLRSIVVIAGGSVIAQAIPVALTPVLTRLYSPSDMGMLALYLAFIGFASSGTTLGYSTAIVSARSDEEASDLTVVSTLAIVPCTLIATLVLWAMISRSWLGYGDLPKVTAIAMGVSLLLTGLFFTLRFWSLREGHYRIISRATIAQSIGRIVAQVLLGLAHLNWVGLISGEILGRGLGLNQMWKSTWSNVSALSLPLNRPRLRRTALEYWKFPLLSTPSAMLNNLALALPVPLISKYFGLQAAGQYAIATRVLLLPLVLVGSSVGDVFHNRIATLSREDPKKAFRFFLGVSAGLFAVGILPMVIVSLFGETLWTAVLGDQWRTAGKIAAALTPWALMQLVVSPVSRVVFIYQGQGIKFIYDVLGLISIVGGFWFGFNQGWSLVNTCALLGWSQACVYGVYFLLLVRTVRTGDGGLK